MSEGTGRPSPAEVGMLVVRYGIGIVMVLGGVVLLIVSPAGTAVDGFGMAVGGGLSVLLLNYLYRISVTSDHDREREEWARDYYGEHGEWPEDEEEAAPGRRWVLPAGAVTYEAEQAKLAAERAAAEQAAEQAAETAKDTLVAA